MAKRTTATTDPAQRRQRFRRRKAKAQGRVPARQEADIRRVEGLPVTQAHAAGIDVGSRSHWVCVGTDEDTRVREFPAHTDGRHAPLAFLREQQVDTVALESTGIYWIPLDELLEAQGIEVLLVDPRYTKHVRGRPKSDRRDCQWIYRLHRVGLLAAAFRPDEKTCQLRSYLRQRANVARYAAQHIQHLQKALEQLNLKLTEVISDMTGTTGQRIIQAVLRGARDPATLARYRDDRCKAGEAAIAQALTGTYRQEHLFALRQAFQAREFYQKQRDQIDRHLDRHLARMKQDRALPALPARKRTYGRKPQEPRVDLTGARRPWATHRGGGPHAAHATRS